MIEIGNSVRKGDIVRAWFTALQPAKGLKPVEVEYRVGELREGWLKLESLTGGYWMVLDAELLNRWNGCVRKAVK